MSLLGTILKKIVPDSVIRHRIGLKKTILFTFDDGPAPNTLKILNVLERFKVKSIFFILSEKVADAPDLLNDIIERGHEIGNHSHSHTSCSEQNFNQIVEEINQCSEIIKDLTGFTTRYYRPPRGIITVPLLFAAKKTNHKIIKWSFDTGEYSYLGGSTRASVLADNFLKNFKDRAIVLSHDTYDEIPAFLEIVLPVLLERGYDLSSGLASIEQ